MKRRLDVLISTMGEAGIRRVASMNLPVVDGVTYIVSWQTAGADPSSLPDDLDRDDVKVYPTDTVGISINRNLAMSQAVAPLCLTADDDLSYTASQLESVISVFDKHPEVDVASFMYESEDCKSYPQVETDLKRLPKGFASSAIEVAYRTASVKGRVHYDENFGPGNHLLQAGEDTVFLLDCRRAGLNCRFFPVVITTHRGLSTGFRPVVKKGVTMANGAYIRKEYGAAGILRLPVVAWRNWRNGLQNFFRGLTELFCGYFMRLK